MALTKVSSSLVSDNAVTSGKIADGGIATADIADVAVTTAKIANNAILTQHIDDGQVTTDQLGADAVTAAKIADDAISEEHLDITVITSLAEVTAATGDLLMVADVSDSNNLKKISVSSILAGTHTGAVNTSGTISSGAITSTGNVAIGGATPQGNLTIKGAASDDIDLLTFSENGSDQSFSFNGNFAGSGSTGNELTLDSYWTNDIMVWGGDGKVGIGDNAPDQKLVVKNGNIKLKSNADGNTGIVMFYDAAGASSGQVYPSAGDLRLWSPNDVLILPTGDVGIGTDSPNAKLEVSGGVISRSTGANYSTGTVAGLFVDATGRGTVRIRSEADAASELFFDVDGGISWDISARQSSDLYNLHFYNRVQASDTLTGVSGPTVVFAQTGNVGIAEITPDERLSLDGNIRFNTTVTTNSTRPSITAATLANGEIRAKNADTGDGGLLRLSAGGGTNANQVSFIDIMGYSNGGGVGPKSIVMGTQGADRLVINENGLATFTGPAAQVNLSGNATGSSALYVNTTSGHTGELLQILRNSVIKMHMANNGDLGIGVVPSVGKLHVAGKIYSTTEVQGGSALIGTSNSLATFGSNNSSTGISISRDSNASSYPDIVVTGDGKVGIGVASPDADFHIDQGPDNRVLITSNGPTLIFKEANTSDDNFGFYLNSSIFNLNTYNDSFGLLSTPLSIKMDGNVGINDTDPDELIAARGTNCVLKLDGTASTGVASVQYADQGTVKWSAGISKNSSQSAGDWSIFEDGASGSPRFTVKDGGSVTIGTTTDNGRKFTVYGSGDLMQLRSTNSGVGGAQLDLTHISSSPADGDMVGIINMSSATKQYSSIRGISSNVNAQGELHLGVRTSSTEYEGSAFQILGDTSLKHKQTSTNTMMFGTPGVGASVEGCWLSIEGNCGTDGEGSGRIFFREHNSTTAAMDNYGMSLGYRGGATTLTSAGGNTWDGLGDIGNGSWGMWGHNNDASGALIMYGSRGGGAVFQGNNSASWSQSSDRRIKKNIEDNTTGLDAINKIRIRNFEYRTEDEIIEVASHAAVKKEGVQLGVIAQEIEEILPDIVTEESTGVKAVNPANLTWYLINAVQEQQTIIDDLKTRLNNAGL